MDPIDYENPPASWNEAKPAVVPRPTYWPALLAFAITFFFWGLVTSWIITVVGAVIFIVAMVGWIAEIIHEHA